MHSLAGGAAIEVMETSPGDGNIDDNVSTVYFSIAMLLLIEQNPPKISQIESYGCQFAHDGGGLLLRIKRVLFCVACKHMISLPTTCLQTYHIFASLAILVDPLANIS